MSLEIKSKEPYQVVNKPTPAFIGVSWIGLIVGILSYFIALYNATMDDYEKGFYFTLIMYGLFAAVSLQKAVRDKDEGIPVTGIYYGISWFSILLCFVLLTLSLWNSEIALSEKGFYAIAYTMALFASVAVQKNIRDLKRISDISSD